jgi:FkbM family methyltransferase
MSFHPAAVLRRSAQSIRHAPGLQGLTPLWNRLRAPYGRLLERLTGSDGVPVRVGGLVMRLAPDTVSLNWETVEVESYRAFIAEIKLGDVVYDIGAHFGTYSIMAARTGGPATRVFAYEPTELTRRYLQKHLRWNGAEGQVTVRPVCVGNTIGEAILYVNPDRPEGTNGLLPYEDFVTTKVPMTTLDREVEQTGLMPALVKIDVEGAELDVLMGATSVLATGRPRLLLSLHPKRLAQAGLDCEAVLQWLSARGYNWRVISEDQERHVLARPVPR